MLTVWSSPKALFFVEVKLELMKVVHLILKMPLPYRFWLLSCHHLIIFWARQDLNGWCIKEADFFSSTKAIGHFSPPSEIKWQKPSSLPFQVAFNAWTCTPSVLSGSPTFVLMHGNSGSRLDPPWAPAVNFALSFLTSAVSCQNCEQPSLRCQNAILPLRQASV